MLKRMSLLSRLPNQSQPCFVKYWQNQHPILVRQLKGLLGYRQSVVKRRIPLSANSFEMFDGIAELWFESEESMRAAMSSPPGLALPADEKKFIGAITTFATPANEPKDDARTFYAICSPPREAVHDQGAFCQAAAHVPCVASVQYNMVTGVIRRPLSPFPKQDVGCFVGFRFAPDADLEAVFADVEFLKFKSFLQKTYWTVCLVEVDQFRVV
jgi:uncharacterized protein (TIGR02118 family)